MIKIGIIDHMINPGGGSRVLRNLLPAIKKLRPDWSIILYANQAGIQREKLDLVFGNQIEIVPLKSVKLINLNFLNKIRGAKIIVSFAQKKFERLLSFFPLFFSGAIHKELEKVCSRCDLVLCTWPFLLKCPKIKTGIPFFAIFHDFCFRYTFDGQTPHPTNLDLLMQEVPRWIDATFPIVTTNFMKSELSKFHPGNEEKTTVIHLSSLSAQTKVSQTEAASIVSRLGISDPYILYPTNTRAHKNVSSLLRAFYLLKKRYPHYKLVFAGFETRSLNGKVASHGLEMGTIDSDVIGLDYLPNLQMDALIQCASVVVSTSFYEAGCGPGLDAWHRGVPVAMSDIAPFTEHFDNLGVRAQVFDPSSPQEIADKIDWILSNPDLAAIDAKHSQEKINSYQWSDVAQKFIDLFEEKLNVKNTSVQALLKRERKEVYQ